jgi:hypothetical protein
MPRRSSIGLLSSGSNESANFVYFADDIIVASISLYRCRGGWIMIVGSMATALSDNTSVHIGPHTLARDGSLLKITARGELTLPQTVELVDYYQAVLDECGHLLIMSDVTNGRGMPADARKLASEWGQRNGDRSRTAVVGASFVVQTVLGLMDRATNLLARRNVPIRFFATEEEARRWLIAQIPILQQAAAPV